jgi:hypothetical protein
VSIEKNNLDDKISLSFLITGLKDWISFLIARKNHIVLVSCSILFFTISHNYLLNPTHYARTTFVLDNDSTSSMGDLSSLASLAGSMHLVLLKLLVFSKLTIFKSFTDPTQ